MTIWGKDNGNGSESYKSNQCNIGNHRPIVHYRFAQLKLIEHDACKLLAKCSKVALHHHEYNIHSYPTKNYYLVNSLMNFPLKTISHGRKKLSQFKEFLFGYHQKMSKSLCHMLVSALYTRKIIIKRLVVRICQNY